MDGCWAEVDRKGAFQTTGAATWKLRRTSCSSSGPWHNACLHAEPNGSLTGYRDASQCHWNADVSEIRWTRAADTVKSSRPKCYLKLYSLRHKQPIEDITKDRSNVVKPVGTVFYYLYGRHQRTKTDGRRHKHHLQTAYVRRDLCR